MQRAERIAAHHGGLRSAGGAPGAFAIEHDKRIQRRLDHFEAAQQVVDDVDGRHPALTHELGERAGRERG